jgi:hypothetical protein
MSTFTELLYQYIVVDDMPPELAARQAISESSQEELLALLFPLVFDRAKRIARNNTRAHEDAVFSGSPVVLRHHDNGVTAEVIPWAETAQRLLTLGFSLPDGRYVTYADSTVRDHRMRALWQRGRASAVLEDAERHEALANLMESHGVKHLGDLDIDSWRELVPELETAEPKDILNTSSER